MREELDPKIDCPRPATLCPADAQALDDLLEHGSGKSLTLDRGGDRQSAQARRLSVSAWLELLKLDHPADPPADLAQRTLGRVEQARWSARVAAVAQALPARGGAWRWSEMLATAAAVVVAFSLLWPALDHSRAEARRVACAANLASAGMAMGKYAQDHAGIMPRGATAPGAAWWTVGQPQPKGQGQIVTSNSAHLYILVRNRYTRARSLACPTNPAGNHDFGSQRFDWPSPESVSYSYQNQYTHQPLRLSQAVNLAVLADRNPMFTIRIDRGKLEFLQHLPRKSPSQAHRGAGQNVLLASGPVLWTSEPVLTRRSKAVVSEDNIWLATGIDQYQGTESPADLDDSFLVP